jgi:hypothetical protein
MGYDEQSSHSQFCTPPLHTAAISFVKTGLQFARKKAPGKLNPESKLHERLFSLIECFHTTSLN